MTIVASAAVVAPDLDVSEATEALRALAALAAEKLPGLSAEELARRFGERERLGTTAIGGGVALPHCRASGLGQPLLLLARAPRGVPFGAGDGLPVRLFAALVTPEGSPAEHLRALAQLSRQLRDANRVADVMAAQGAEEMVAAWQREPGAAA